MSENDRRRIRLEHQEMQLNSMLGSHNRRNILKGMSVLGFAGLAAPLLAACGLAGGSDSSAATSGPAGGKQDALTAQMISTKYGAKTIGDSWHSLELAIIADRARGGEAAAAALGQTYRGISADLKPVKQLSDVQTAFTSGLLAMNVVPIEAPEVNTFAPEAKSANALYTTSYNSPAWKTPVEYGPQYVGYFAPDDYKTGQLTAQKLFEHLGGKGDVVHLEGVDGATANALRTAGVKSVLAKFPNIKTVASINTDWSTVDANNKMQNLLSSVSNIDGVIAADDDIGIGAYTAIKGAGKEIPIVSSDGTQEAFKLTASSFYLGTVNTYTEFVGGFLLVRLFDALNGWKPKPAETMMFGPTGFADAAASVKLLDRFYKGSSIPYNFAKMSQVLYPDDWDTQEQMVTMDPAYVWQTAQKPSGYSLPSGFDAASRKAVDGLYYKHWITRAV